MRGPARYEQTTIRTDNDTNKTMVYKLTAALQALLKRLKEKRLIIPATARIFQVQMR